MRRREFPALTLWLRNLPFGKAAQGTLEHARKAVNAEHGQKYPHTHNHYRVTPRVAGPHFCPVLDIVTRKAESLQCFKTS